MATPATARGTFLVLEGTDGSGLSTQAALLRDRLLAAGRAAYLTKEPSDGPAGAMVRLALTQRLGYAPHTSHSAGADTPAEPWQPIGDEVLALLYAADRLDHLRQDIAPRLARGVDVICDRYRLSSLAYQSLSADLDWVTTLNSKARRPDLTIFLDVPPEICRTRMARRQGAIELYEQESKIRRVRENYLRLIPAAQAAGEAIVVVDGRGTPAAVAAAVWAACQAAFPAVY
ncbi:MAG TPA: dTMP kinase [Chloroflexia bacterium]|nr:dTMP kinase [Chloroflexia bacterium]